MYSTFGKAFEKQIKAIEEQGKKQVEALKVSKPNIPENTLSEKAKNEFNKIKEIEKSLDEEKLCYRTNEYKYNFQNFLTINTFGRDIYNGTITLKEDDKIKVIY